MPDKSNKSGFLKLHLRLIALVGVIVPRRLRADWRQEWEAELRCREMLLAEWDRLDWRNRLYLLKRSLGAFWDALLLQPKRLEDEMIQDLRFGFRALSARPGFTVIAVLALGLGIGATTLIFSVVNSVLLRPLSFPNPERIVRIGENHQRDGLNIANVSYANYNDLVEQTQTLEQVAATRFWLANLSE
ncbi:MAG: ABC transporter permease, partial [Acidobacteria bacterium]|nr:ABC transporter permease [Acidobacteriota bacterium]